MMRPASSPGWLLEPGGDARPRGMTVTPQGAQNPAYRPTPSNNKCRAKRHSGPLPRKRGRARGAPALGCVPHEAKRGTTVHLPSGKWRRAAQGAIATEPPACGERCLPCGKQANPSRCCLSHPTPEGGLRSVGSSHMNTEKFHAFKGLDQVPEKLRKGSAGVAFLLICKQKIVDSLKSRDYRGALCEIVGFRGKPRHVSR